MPKPDETPDRELSAFERYYNALFRPWDGENAVKNSIQQPLPFTRSPSTTFRQVISISRRLLLQSKLTQKEVVQESIKRCCSAMAEYLLVNYPRLLNNFLEFDFAFLFRDNTPVSGSGGGEVSFIVSIAPLFGLPQAIIDVAIGMWRLPPGNIDSAYYEKWPVLSTTQSSLLQSVDTWGHRRFVFERVLLSNTYILSSTADDAFRFQMLYQALCRLFDSWVSAKTVWIGNFPTTGHHFTKMVGYLTDVTVDVSWGDPKTGPGNYHAVSLYYANEVPASLYPDTFLALPASETFVTDLPPGKVTIGSSPLVDPNIKPKAKAAPAVYVPLVKPMTLKNLLDELRKEDDTI